VRHWEEVLTLDPENGAALYALACLHRRAGDDGNALLLLDTLERVDPIGGRGHLLRAEILMDRRDGLPPDSAGAVAAARRALDLNPEESGSHLAMGRALAADGLRDEALERLRVAAVMNPRDPESRSLLGLLHLGRDEGEAAATQFRRALDVAAGRMEVGTGAEVKGEGDTLPAPDRSWRPGPGELRALAGLWLLDRPVPVVPEEENALPPGVAAAVREALARRGVLGGVTLDLDGDGRTDAVAVERPPSAAVLVRQTADGPRLAPLAPKGESAPRKFPSGPSR
jgi:hypothetical protein